MGRYIGNAQVVGKEHAYDWVHIKSANWRVNSQVEGSSVMHRPTSVGFTNIFTDDFDEYKFILTNFRVANPTSGDTYASLYARFNAVGEDGWNESVSDNHAQQNSAWHYTSGGDSGGYYGYAGNSGTGGIRLCGNISVSETFGRAGWKDEYSRWGDWNITGIAGEFIIIRPQDTTFRKYWYCRGVSGLDPNGNQRNGLYMGGYVETASALSDIKFYWNGSQPFYSFDVEIYGLGK